MTERAHLTAAEIRERVGHPIVDADGHFMEFMPLVDDEIVSYLEEEGGAALRDRFLSSQSQVMDTAVFADRRSDPAIVDSWRAMPSWWGNPVSDPLDRATAYLPQLMNERLGELGIDFMLIYPSWTLGFLETRDDALRAPVCRATNRYFASLFAGLKDRFEPAALIPMQTPEEAVAEINFAARELGFKSVVLHGFAHRPVGAGATGASTSSASTARSTTTRCGPPAWRTTSLPPSTAPCRATIRAGRSPTTSTTTSTGSPAPIRCCANPSSSAVSTGGSPSCASGFSRVGSPGPRACWPISSATGTSGAVTPSVISIRPTSTWRPCWSWSTSTEPRTWCATGTGSVPISHGRRAARPSSTSSPAAGITSIEDILEPFENRLYFGCEADDPLIGVGYGLNFEGREAALRPIIGSDVSHWDAPVMNQVIVEAYELLEYGIISPEQFREFTFTNPVRLHGGANPSFFEGTAVASEAREVLG